MGKTYAAALPPMLLGPVGSPHAPPPLTLLWITPLRALAGDTGLAIARAATDLPPHWTVDARTGDTGPAAPRQDRRCRHARPRRRPHAAPRRADWRLRFAHLGAIVVDGGTS
jgi:ATP-dependent Lhr-like helicase